jgi:hypothetical protein
VASPAKAPATTKGVTSGAAKSAPKSVPKSAPKAPVQQMALPLDQVAGSPAKTPKTVSKPVTKLAPVKSADSATSASPKVGAEGKAPPVARKAPPKPVAAGPRAGGSTPPAAGEKVEPKRAGQDDILIRFRGGKVGWMQRDK